jgi:hypothetical protein
MMLLLRGGGGGGDDDGAAAAATTPAPSALATAATIYGKWHSRVRSIGWCAGAPLLLPLSLLTVPPLSLLLSLLVRPLLLLET